MKIFIRIDCIFFQNKTNWMILDFSEKLNWNQVVALSSTYKSFYKVCTQDCLLKYLCDLNLAGLNVNLDQMHFYFTILMHKMNLRWKFIL